MAENESGLSLTERVRGWEHLGIAPPAPHSPPRNSWMKWASLPLLRPEAVYAAEF